MPNHFHLLIESGATQTLSEFMRRILTAYTMFFNTQHKRHGHLFQGRFKSYLVDKTEYFLALSRYIHLNPARERDISYIETYGGSSLMFYLNGNEPPFLVTRETLDWFKGDRAAYGMFVREGLSENIKPMVLQQRFVGGEDFAHRVRKRLGAMQNSGSRGSQAYIRMHADHEARQVRKAKNILADTAHHFGVKEQDLVRKGAKYGVMNRARSVLVIMLRDHVAWTHARIAAFVGLSHPSGVPYHLRKREKEELVAESVGAISEKIITNE